MYTHRRTHTLSQMSISKIMVSEHSLSFSHSLTVSLFLSLSLSQMSISEFVMVVMGEATEHAINHNCRSVDVCVCMCV